jgi:hypothetical protein
MKTLLKKLAVGAIALAIAGDLVAMLHLFFAKPGEEFRALVELSPKANQLAAHLQL